jgi:hypothetical protein
MGKIISISLTDEEKEWIDAMELSPTALMKFKIQESMLNSLGMRKQLKEQAEKIERLAQNIQKYATFLETKQLVEEFNGFNL